MSVKFLTVILFFASMPAFSYDCSQAQPFTPFEPQKVTISVDRFYWTVENGQQIQKSEQVCETTSPLEIGAFDIRGRETEWYYCFYQVERPRLECQTTFNGKPAFLIVRPAVAIRSYSTSPGARDTHAHIFLAPDQDWSQYRDTFIRSMSLDLSTQDVLLDSVTGGQGPNSNEDSFGVKLHYF